MPQKVLPNRQSYQPDRAQDDALARQYEEYYRMQQQMNQVTMEAYKGARNPSSAAQMPPVNKNSSSNVIAHEIIDVRASSKPNSTLMNNGAEIFNSGGYSNSQK